jgi:murein DD-endopeptidase MepM/ murein hydrolase activator NlpD
MRSWLLSLALAAAFGITGFASTADAAAIRLADRVQPGGLVIGQTAPGSSVHVDDRHVRVSNDGRFVFGVGRDAKGAVDVRIKLPGREEIKQAVNISKRDYLIQRIDGLPARKVEPTPEDQAKIEADWILLNKAKSTDSDALAFADQAIWPVIGPISGIFGSQRILNGKPRSPHRGVDVAARQGTAVNAMLDGVVTIASQDMYYTGGTVMVDHGHGVQSLYAHLASIDVDVGQKLTRGEQLGTIGSTGRSTGPHLHLSLYWFDTALDPALILGPMPTHRPRLKPSLAAGKD